jgi:hypothetical protein
MAQELLYLATNAQELRQIKGAALQAANQFDRASLAKRMLSVVRLKVMG